MQRLAHLLRRRSWASRRRSARLRARLAALGRQASSPLLLLMRASRVVAEAIEVGQQQEQLLRRYEEEQQLLDRLLGWMRVSEEHGSRTNALMDWLSRAVGQLGGDLAESPQAPPLTVRQEQKLVVQAHVLRLEAEALQREQMELLFEVQQAMPHTWGRGGGSRSRPQ